MPTGPASSPHFALSIEAPRRGGASKIPPPKFVKPVQIALLPEVFADPRQQSMDPRELKRRQAADAERSKRAGTMGGLFK